MKKNIATVTFNPAIDETVLINNFRTGHVNRVERVQRHAGGKGINVATFISDFGFQSSCTGFLGNGNDRIFTNHFNMKNIADNMVRISGETRTGIKVIDDYHGETTDINYPGIVPTGDDISSLFTMIKEMTSDHDIFVVSGSLPAGVDAKLYGEVVEMIKTSGAQVVVDTSGPAFHEALKYAPDVIKPNNHELSEYFGKELETTKELAAAAEDFFKKGIKTVVVSMGSKGALFLAENERICAVPPLTKAVSTVGAGDAMVAGIVCGMVEGRNLAGIASLSTSFSLNAISHVKLGLQDPGKLQKTEEAVTVETF